MLALSIRQPYAELILRGIKTVEYRSRPCRMLGERFYVYASGRKSELRNPKSESTSKLEARKIIGENIVAPDEALPPWMIELAEQFKLIPGFDRLTLPTGVIVGSAVIDKVQELAESCQLSAVGSLYAWHLCDVKRLKKPIKPVGHPQPMWWRPG